MKRLINVITHPLFIILSFCFIVVSGEQTGGFYLIYILFGLPHLVMHSLLGVVGIVCVALRSDNWKATNVITVKILGIGCMVTSLVRFFLQPGGSYNYNTFYQTVPLITLIIFGAIALLFIAFNAPLLLKRIK